MTTNVRLVPSAMFLVLLLGPLLGLGEALHVALFPSSGCYSHDVMMKGVGQLLDDRHRLSWVQIFMYDFGFGTASIPSSWTNVTLIRHDDEGLFLFLFFSFHSALFERPKEP